MAIPAEFEFRFEFRQNGNYNLAGTPAKIPFPRNSRNHPDSGGFHLEYMGDCKELVRTSKNQSEESIRVKLTEIGMKDHSF